MLKMHIEPDRVRLIHSVTKLKQTEVAAVEVNFKEKHFNSVYSYSNFKYRYYICY